MYACTAVEATKCIYNMARCHVYNIILYNIYTVTSIVHTSRSVAFHSCILMMATPRRWHSLGALMEGLFRSLAAKPKHWTCTLAEVCTAVPFSCTNVPQLSTDNMCIIDIQTVMTHCAPLPIDKHFYSSGVVIWTIHQSDGFCIKHIVHKGKTMGLILAHDVIVCNYKAAADPWTCIRGFDLTNGVLATKVTVAINVFC